MTSQQSLRQQVRDQITEYSRLTQGLFTSFDILAEGKTPPESPNDMMKQIVQLDNTLMGNVDKIEQHQIQQRKILQVRKEIEGVDKAIMEVIRTLRMAKETLEASLENHDEKMAASTDARLAEIPVSEIVAYANRLGNYTSAPPNFNPADPNQPFEPPYPREVSMRAGILNQQHVPAAALVSLDGGVMPGMAGQPIQPLVVPGESGEGVTPAGGIVSGVGAGVGVGGDAGTGVGVGGLMNGHMGMMPPHGLMDEDDDDSGSSSEDDGLSFYGRNKERQDQYQQQQQQQQQQQEPDDEDAADIFDLDLS
ncbi:MAG: vitamin-D-receptor interacting mediator subunit 4-domain-containing protein [Linnemannia elongata]|nr:MAG: vitamin-D-receptor interacting mediator subunit 4-domain-containing protein [Linnemannia elongata]